MAPNDENAPDLEATPGETATPPASGDQNGPGFEETLKALEALVEEMERGEMPLERALESFERGTELARRCNEILERAEQRVRILDGQGETAQTVPFHRDA